MKEDEIDKILASLDDVERATAPMDFRERVFRQIQSAKSSIDPWYSRLKYSMAAMIALLMINGYILFQGNLLIGQEEMTIEVLADEWYSESDVIEYNYEVE